MYEMGNAYIFTHGTQHSDGFRWYFLSEYGKA